MRPVPVKLVLVLSAGLALAAAWYARHVDLSQFVTDDGGIYLRYAERIAQGKGFNYNDGESVNGASSTLFTLLLALLLRLGLAPAAAIFHLGVACFAATIALLFYTLARHASLFAAIFAVLAYLSTDFLFGYLFDALEPNLILLLATLLFHALHTRSEIYAGVVVGLLVACKLDGAFAAIALALGWLFVRQRFPWKVALAALATAAPAFVLQLVCFGSILPNSAIAKMQAETEGGGFVPAWVSANLLHFLPGLYLPALFSFAIRGDLERSLPRRVLQLWLILHVAFFSLVDLSAPFPWYCSLPAYLVIVLAALTVDALFGTGAASAMRTGSGASSRFERAAARTVFALVLGAVFLLHGWPTMLGRLRRPDAPDRVQAASASEIARLASGAWLRKHTSGRELFCSGFGLPAFEYKGPVYDLLLLNSRPDPDYLERAKYIVDGPYHGDHTPATKLDDTGFGLIATFRYGADAGLYALFASDDSEAKRAGLYHLTIPLASSAPLDARTGAPLAAQAYQARPRGLATRLPTDLWLDVDSPSAARVDVTPVLELADGHATKVRIRVTINGETVLDETLEPGTTGTRRVAAAGARDPHGRYRIGLFAERLDGAVSAGSVLWRDLDARAGEPLAPSDFSVMCPPWAHRIRAVERSALP